MAPRYNAYAQESWYLVRVVRENEGRTGMKRRTKKGSICDSRRYHSARRRPAIFATLWNCMVMALDCSTLHCARAPRSRVRTMHEKRHPKGGVSHGLR